MMHAGEWRFASFRCAGQSRQRQPRVHQANDDISDNNRQARIAGLERKQALELELQASAKSRLALFLYSLSFANGSVCDGWLS